MSSLCPPDGSSCDAGVPDPSCSESRRVPQLPRSALVAPKQSGQFLFDPAPADVPAVLEQNRRFFESLKEPVAGRSWSLLRSEARVEALDAAVRYTEDVLGLPAAVRSYEHVIVSGHQPEIFHPGVWAKNFALAEVARRAGAAALNLVVDNDTMAHTGVKVPPSPDAPTASVRVPFDETQPARPWEEATVRDPETFARFGGRLRDALAPWGIDPILADAWKNLRPEGRLCDQFTKLRAGLEREHGADNLELPLSWLCETTSFKRFLIWIVGRLPEFHALYNRVVQDYRRAHGVRTKSRPVPDLARDGEWLEAPFWCWRKDDTNRDRLFVRLDGDRVTLRDRRGELGRFTLPTGMDDAAAVAALERIARDGVRLRTRALTTTLYARLFLGDLFIHGIGGAKYDEMTDAIIRGLFGGCVPRFMTATATWHLPLPVTSSVEPADLDRLRQLQRDLDQNPDRHLPTATSPEIAGLLAERQGLLGQQRQAENREDRHLKRAVRRRLNHERYRRLHDIRDRLREEVAPQRTKVEQDIAGLTEQLAARRQLKSREYAYGLFPAPAITAFVADVRRQFD